MEGTNGLYNCEREKRDIFLILDIRRETCLESF
jgi:hypothetical protein